MKKIILASKSPRRKALLEKAHLKFDIIPSKYKEEKNEKFNIEFIKKVSYCKAQDVAQSIDFDAVVISADTMVILDSVCLTKPRNYNEAFLFLKKLSNVWHKVTTAITIIDTANNKTIQNITTTKVKFRALEEKEIEDYIKNFNPKDKAGSYGIQDFLNEKTVKNPPKSSFIEKIEGSFENVIGLDTKTLIEMLNEINAL